MTAKQLIFLSNQPDFMQKIQDSHTHVNSHTKQTPHNLLTQMYNGKTSHSSFDSTINIEKIIIQNIQINAQRIISWINNSSANDTIIIRATTGRASAGYGAYKTNQNLIRAKNTNGINIVLRKYAGDLYGFHVKTAYPNILQKQTAFNPVLQSQLHTEVPNMPEFATACPEEKAYLLYQTDPSSHNLAVYSDNDPDFNGKPSLSLYYPLGSDLYRIKLSGTNAVWEKHPINDPQAPYQPASPSSLQTRYPDYAATQTKLEALIQTHTPKPRRLPDPIEQSSDEEEDEMQI